MAENRNGTNTDTMNCETCVENNVLNGTNLIESEINDINCNIEVIQDDVINGDTSCNYDVIICDTSCNYVDKMLESLPSLNCDECMNDSSVLHEIIENELDIETIENSIRQEVDIHYEKHSEIKELRQLYPENMIIGHLNVNSFDMKSLEIKNMLLEGKLDALMLSETKLDNSFQNSLYEVNGYIMYRQDKRSNSGGLLAYVSKDIPSTSGPINISTENVECMSIELNVREHKILLVCMYKNPKMKPHDFKMFFENTCEKIFDEFEHVIIIGDLNFNMLNNNTLANLCPTLNLTNIIDSPTCFKSNTPTLIDVMLVTKRKFLI